MRRPLMLALLLTALATPAVAHAGPFSSPSGNIGCYIDRTFVRCDINAKDWTAPKPKGCDLDSGQGLTVGRRSRKGQVVCAGDTTLTKQHPLAYGRTIRRATMRCRSSQAGMRCRNGRGHGFFISRQRYELF